MTRWLVLLVKTDGGVRVRFHGVEAKTEENACLLAFAEYAEDEESINAVAYSLSEISDLVKQVREHGVETPILN